MCTVHLHYVSSQTHSVKQSNKALYSFQSHGWNVKLVDGITPNTTDTSVMPLPGGRLDDILANKPFSYRTKLAIDENHRNFWKMTASSNTVQIYAEHDVICKRDVFDLPSFEDILALQLDCTTVDHLFDKVFNGYKYKSRLLANQPGIYNLPHHWSWTYTCDTQYKGSKLIPGASCYALTPAGARKLLHEVEEFTEQSDMIINDSVVDIKYITPSLVDLQRDIKVTSLGSLYEA